MDMLQNRSFGHALNLSRKAISIKQLREQANSLSQEFNKQIMRPKKYYTSKNEAIAACEERNRIYGTHCQVFKMPKGTRRHGEYAVCTHLEFINTL